VKRALAVTFLLAAACGGGGGAPVLEVLFDFQTVSASSPTPASVVFGNPVGASARLTLVEAPAGPFSAAPGQLPKLVGSSPDVVLDVVFTPGDAGPHETTWRLRLEGSGGERSVVLTLRASVEPPKLSLDTLSVDFGEVGLAESTTRSIRVRNSALLTVESVVGIQGLPADFSLLGPALPALLPPGETLDLQVRYAPTVLRNSSFPVDVVTGRGPALRAQLSGRTTGWAAEILVDYGTVPFTANDTPLLRADVPADAISFTIEARGVVGDRIGLRELTGPDGTVYENPSSTGAYVWEEGYEAFAATIPNSDRANVQLVPGGGSYSFRLRRIAGPSSSLRIRAIIHNRPGGQSSPEEVDLNVHLAPGLAVDAALGPFDSNLSATLAEAERILGKRGISFGAISYFDLDDSSYDFVSSQVEIDNLFRESAAGPDGRLNLFLVRGLFGGTVGITARINGPTFGGTTMSGLVVAYEFGNSTEVGYVVAHEAGHYLGLYHTVESSGSHDFIDDTLDCPSSGTAPPCTTPGGSYLMHWLVLDVDPIVTAGQGKVLRAHALMKPPSGLLSAPLRAAPAERPGLRPALFAPGWCGAPGCPGGK
jgi:hypothetical protein